MIYLDNAATTAPNKEALRIATQKYEELFYNPSASYKQGAEVHALIEDCKRTILETLVNEENIAEYDIIFTGSGTEADNLALSVIGGNIVYSNGEHAAVYNKASNQPSRVIELFGKDDYSLSHVSGGLSELLNKLNCVVSVCHVNSEMGEITDICTYARKIKEKYPYILFHSDGVQAYGKIPFKLTPDIDMYSISAHKIGGIKGIGALVYRKEVKDRLRPVIYGGGQENGLRSGTENVLGIIDFAEAVKRWGIDNSHTSIKMDFLTRVAILENVIRDKKLSFLNYIKDFSDIDGNALYLILSNEFYTVNIKTCGFYSPYILTVSAKGKNNEVIQKILEEKYGILVGIGSACSSNHAENKGRVLRALGYEDDIINGALRFSFSPQTTAEEIRTAAKAVNEVVWSLS